MLTIAFLLVDAVGRVMLRRVALVLGPVTDTPQSSAQMARSLQLLRANISGQGVMVRSFRTIVLETGIAGGLLFTIHASIPNCQSWPMIWPALAGAAAVWLATREPRPDRWRTGLVAALVTGVVTGVVAFVGISTVVYVVVHSGIASSLQQNGASSPALTASVTAARTVAIGASLAAIDLIVAFLGGVLMLPARYFQTRHAHA